jgi:hypothetical protein
MRPIGLTLLGVVLATTLAVAAGKPGYPDKVVWSGGTWAIKTSRSAARAALGSGSCVGQQVEDRRRGRE